MPFQRGIFLRVIFGVLVTAPAFADLKKSTLNVNPLVFSGSGSLSAAAVQHIDEGVAKQKLASKLERLGKDPDMQEGSYPNSEAGGKSFNANDKNPFKSNTTYHSYVWSYCMEWQGPKNCGKWLDPYAPLHAFEGDSSILEETVGKEWRAMKKEGETGENGSYAIWNVESNGQAIVDPMTGKLDLTALNKMSLKNEVQNKIKKVANDTADRTIASTYDENSGGKEQEVMPNIESLRKSAENFTKMFRNRMLSIVGAGRANQVGVEFALGEEIADCAAYLQATRRNPPEDDPTEDRIKPQAPLDPQTIGVGLEDRYKQCQQLMATSAYKASSGDERIDVWRARANMAAIDQGGIDPNSLPKPQGVQLTEDEVTSKVTKYDNAGQAIAEEKETNKKTLEGYNQQLAEAAASIAEASKASPSYIADSSAQIMANQVGNVNLVKFNGMTQEMNAELKGTSFAQSQANTPVITNKFEQAPSELTVRAIP